MQSRTGLVLAITLLGSACAFRVFGPARSRVEGWVYTIEDARPLPQAEVCAMGLDTACVRADQRGHYQVHLTEQTVVFRFRYGALAVAVSDSLVVLPPARYTVNCALTSRMVLSDHPIPCQPVPGH